MKIVTILLIIAGIILSIYILSIMGYLMVRHIATIFEKIDMYYDLKDMSKEQEEIYKFKKNL